MRARVICIASAKGGSGKTSLTATLGTFLSSLKKNILLIDADSATNGLTLLYVKEIRVGAELLRSVGRVPTGLFDGISSKALCDVVDLGNGLHIIPASYNLQMLESSSNESTSQYVRSMIIEMRGKYDYIFIDAQAGLDDMAQIAMNRRVSDEVVIVSEYDPMSAAGVERLKAMLREDLTYDRTWVLLNKILPEFAASFGDFLEVAKYLSPIPWDAEVVRAYARRRLAIDTETGNEYTLSVMQTLKGLCGDAISGQLEEWIQSRAAVIRQPIEQQYSDAEREMKFLLYQKTRIRQKESRGRLIAALFSVSVGVTAMYGLTIVLPDLFKESKLDVPIVIGIAGLALAAITFLVSSRGMYRSMFALPEVESQLEEERFDRQFDLLKERLKRLELLRTLDPESLLEHRARRPNELSRDGDMRDTSRRSAV